MTTMEVAEYLKVTERSTCWVGGQNDMPMHSSPSRDHKAAPANSIEPDRDPQRGDFAGASDLSIKQPSANMPFDPYFAHSANAYGVRHHLVEHLSCVSKLAGKFLQGQKGAEEAALAGLLHDLGKYGDLFQARLRGEAQGLDHWSQGAWLALTEHRAIAAALAIQGHHIGLQRADNEALRKMNLQCLEQNHPLRLALSDCNLERLKQRAAADGLLFQTLTQRVLPLQNGAEQAVAAMLDVRLLFSCLVDADYLDTEAHFEGALCGKRYRVSGQKLDPQAALTAVLEHIQHIQSQNIATDPVATARKNLLTACLNSASEPTGYYTLTAPTGSGKTLAMLAFALAHAANHGLKRIILAVPYLTIIEQTANIYRAIFTAQPQFGEGYVLEHHSMAGLGKELHCQDNEGKETERSHIERQRRLLTQNWDAPIVITTNVQLLESMFSNRPGTCRKLHNLMESVILFDEAQSLPLSLAVPTLAALSHLTTEYRSTVIFATATQPAFATLDHAVRKQAKNGWAPEQIVKDHVSMFRTLRRVEVVWPKDRRQVGWDELSAQLCESQRALCVVNLKRHAVALGDALTGEEGIYHLSTNLCPEHRRETLNTVRGLLRTTGQLCRLLSTQCVEAGVDIDFPHVFRAFGPLESIAQAAGRCNREGRLDLGKVIVFDPVGEGNWRGLYPSFSYYQAAEVTRTMLAVSGPIDINDPESFADYYQRLYNLNNSGAKNPELNAAILSLDFPEISHQYRLIEHDSLQVLVPWSKRLSLYAELCEQESKRGIDIDWIRRSQNIAVSIYRPKLGHPAWSVLTPAKLRHINNRTGESDEWFILQDPDGIYYDDVFGLHLPDSDPIFIA